VNGEAGKGLLIESGAVRVRRRIGTIICVIVVVAALLLLVPGSAVAQVVEVTPEFEIDRSTETTPWVIWFAIGAAVLGALVLLGVGFGYMRFAPKFFGREEASRLPPGARPAHLVRQAASVRWAPPQAAAPAPAPAPAPAAEDESAQASSQATAPPAGEAAVQADAAGQAEAEAPEEAHPTEAAAEEAAPAEPPAAEPAPAGAPVVAQAPPATQGSSALDEETFERVLKEQTDKGVDRRVAEGRARAAAVVAARRKAQG
jgi:ribonuclease E